MVTRIKTHKKKEVFYNTWETQEEKERAFAQTTNALKNVEPIFYSKAATIFENTDTNINVRQGMSRDDYNYFRPDESVPQDYKGMIQSCRKAYKTNGIVRNVIDIMSDFVCKGVQLVHTNKKNNVLLQEWANQVDLAERSERFANLVLREGNVVIKKTHAKLGFKDKENLQRGFASPDIKPSKPISIEKNEIPWSYSFLNPTTLDVLGGEDLSIFAGEMNYALNIPKSIINQVKYPKTDVQRKLLEKIPDYIVKAIRNGETKIPLDSSKTVVYNYKKDDWQIWGEPIIYSVLPDLIMLEKLKLADMAALDGAISHIRLWKLGSLEHKIAPAPAAMSRLSDILSNGVGGGSMDLIWGPDITLEETSTDIYRFLGSEKYSATLSAIYSGLGVPGSLTGSGKGTGGSYTNNFVSLKTMTERLLYCRALLINFWQNELKVIQKAFGWKKPGFVRFDRMVLTDDAAEKALLVQLADRNLISIETIQERFGEIPELELLRIKREDRMRDAGTFSDRAGPFHNANHEQEMEKLAMQSGVYTPSEFGLELQPRKDGEVPPMEQKAKHDLEQSKVKGQPGQGRPINSKDKTKRKNKKVVPLKANIMNAYHWARSAQEKINNIFNPIYLDFTQKKNMRSLTDSEAVKAEEIKFALLCNLKLFNEFDAETLMPMISGDLKIPENIDILCKSTIEKFSEKFNRHPTIEEIRQIQAQAYGFYNGV